MMAAAFDAKLRERFLERSLNGRDFFRAMIFFHCGFGPLDSRFRRRGIDFFRFESHIG